MENTQKNSNQEDQSGDQGSTNQSANQNGNQSANQSTKQSGGAANSNSASYEITSAQITSQIRSSGIFDEWRDAIKEKYLQSEEFPQIKEKALQILEESKSVLTDPSYTREQKFQSLFKSLFQNKSLHQEIKKDLSTLLKKNLSQDMKDKCNSTLKELQKKRNLEHIRVQGEKAISHYEETEVTPLKKSIESEETALNSNMDWIANSPAENKKNSTVSDELANLAHYIDTEIFEKDSIVEENFLKQIRNVGDRITIPILGYLGLVVEKDRVLCRVNGRETSGKISRDLRIRWTHPVTQNWYKFDTVAHFVGHVNLNLEPVSKIPLQYDGWSECTLIRDANQMKKETPFVELRKRAVEKLRNLSVEKRLEQEKVTAHPSFEASQALKRDRSEMENNFQAIEESIGSQSTHQPRKKRKMNDDEE